MALTRPGDRSAAQPTSALRPSVAAAVAALRGELPARYAEDWRAPFDRRLGARLRPGMRVLDIGAGWKPSVAPAQRPADCHYVGLDSSLAELERAPAGSYDELVAADVGEHLPALDGAFDFVVSCQVLEHLKVLSPTVANLRSYLRPGGRLVAFFSGTFAAYAILNRMLPHRVSVWAMGTLLDRPADTMFPAYYDRCWATALERVFDEWSEVEITPRWFAAPYFGFLRPLQGLYVGYEEWARLTGRDNLAPYYLLEAVR